MSELSKLKQRIRNLETTYNNQKNRSLRFEKNGVGLDTYNQKDYI